MKNAWRETNGRQQVAGSNIFNFFAVFVFFVCVSLLVAVAVYVAFSSAAAVAVVCEHLLLWRYVDHCDLLAVAFGISYYTHSNGIHKREI